MTLFECERAFRVGMIREALQRHEGNRSKTAKELGITLRHLLRLIRAYGLAPRGVEPESVQNQGLEGHDDAQ